jgi:hypothetical protein
MALFDGDFDPQQFEGSGGLLDRLLALQQQQAPYQPPQGFAVASDQTLGGGSINQPASPVLPPQSGTTAMTPLPSSGVPNWPSTGQPAPASPTSDYGPSAYIRVGNYLMPQFGPIDAPQTTQPSHDLGDRLWAGFQSWAHTPVGNPFAALANGIAGFKSGQNIEPAAVPQTRASRAEIPQPQPPMQDLTSNPTVANRSAQRILTTRLMPRSNNFNSRRSF